MDVSVTQLHYWKHLYPFDTGQIPTDSVRSGWLFARHCTFWDRPNWHRTELGLAKVERESRPLACCPVHHCVHSFEVPALQSVFYELETDVMCSAAP